MYEFLEYRVADAMTRDLVTLPPEATIDDAERCFQEHQINGIPILGAAGRFLGLVTKLDVLAAFRFDENSLFPRYDQIAKRALREVMTPARDVVSVTSREKLTRVLRKMVEQRTKSFPVLDEDRLVGVIAREDILEALRRSVAGEVPTDPL